MFACNCYFCQNYCFKLKLKLRTLDKFILLLISFSILVDMVNGFFIRENVPLPISQVFKFFIILLFLLRLSKTKDFLYVIFIFIGFQIAPVFGLLKTGNFSTYINDVIAATKWFNVPLSLFYFKALFQSKSIKNLLKHLKRMISLSFIFLGLNMILGVLGFGSAFYYEGYGNAAGTKGFIYAGNELTILVLVIAFIMVNHFRYLGKHTHNIFFFIVFLFFAFAITSKTVIGGVALVFLIPYISSIRWKFKKKWAYRIIGIIVLGIPLTVITFYIGIINSGFLQILQQSKRVNGDFLTILLSNRNNFVVRGWQVFTQDYNWFEKLLGLGEGFYVHKAGDIAEIDFVTLLFSGGFFALMLLLVIILYYFVNAGFLMRIKTYVHAKSVFVFLIFICVAANLAGHIFDSGIAGFFIGFAIALMFYKSSPTPIPKATEI